MSLCELRRNAPGRRLQKRMKENDKIYIQDREAGNVIVWFDTKEEAEKKLAEYEQSDIEEGIYEENFYEIVEK